MNLGQIVSRVQAAIGNDKAADRDDIVDFVNLAIREIYEVADWWWSIKTTTMGSESSYETPSPDTGKMAVTQDSNVMTASGVGTGFNDKYVGHHLYLKVTTGQPSHDGFIFRITDVNTATNVITVDKNYHFADATLDFVAFTWLYALPADFKKVIHVRKMSYGNELKNEGREGTQEIFPVEETEIPEEIANPFFKDEPFYYRVLGNRGFDQYSKGTVRVTQGSKEVIYNPAAAETVNNNLFPRKIPRWIRVGTDEKMYDIDNIDLSPTNKFILFEPYRGATNATASYVINPANSKALMWLPNSNLAMFAIMEYYSVEQPLVADAEISKIPEQYHNVIIEGAIVQALQFDYEDDALYQRVFTRYRNALEEMKRANRANSRIDKSMLGFKDFQGYSYRRHPRFPDEYGGW